MIKIKEECTIGYFHKEGGAYTGKNREPGKNSLDVLTVKSKEIEEPKMVYVGIDPWQETSISNSIYKAHENDNIFNPQEDLNIDLYGLEGGEELPQELEGKLSDNIWGGIYPDRRVGMPASSPTKAVYLLPSDLDPMGGDITSVANTSFYNLSRSWGGMNEDGLSVFSSSIRHDDRLKNRPSYSVLTNEILGKFGDVDEAVKYFEDRVENYKAGAANFLIANKDKQIILEYIPEDVVSEINSPSVNITEDLDTDFRTNFAIETEFQDRVGFFKRDDWAIENAQNIDEILNYIRSINRKMVCSEEVDGKEEGVYSSHTVFPELYKNKEVLEEVSKSHRRGELEDIALSQKEKFASFFSVCTHPVMEQLDWHEEEVKPTYKRTQWSWVCDLNNNTSQLKYDNPCTGHSDVSTEIDIDLDEINTALRVLD